MIRWLQFILLLLTASAFAHVPAPKEISPKTHTLAREDFTDYRNYDYATLSRRLATERLNLDATKGWTNVFGYDEGADGGPGVLTRMAEPQTGGAEWTATLDGFNRIERETNNVVRRPAQGRLNATPQYGSVSVALDGRALPVNTFSTGDPNWPTEWRTEMELRPGPRTLTATARHGSGMFTTNTSVTFTNNAVDQTTVSHFAEGQLSHRVWKNSLGQTNRVQTFTWDARSRLIATTEVDDQNNGYNWSAVYDGLGRRLQTTTVLVTNGVALNTQPKTINSLFDPNVEFLELGVKVAGKQRWKVYGPDLDGRYGGMNGTGGLDGVVDDIGVVRPLVSDARGNVLGTYDPVETEMQWNTSRPTGYGAVPEHRPLALSDSGDVGAAVGWRGRWPDRSGLIWLGARYYDPVAGRFISCDPYGHDADPSLYAFGGGDPINYFDPDGRLGKGVGGGGMDLLYGAAGLVNNTLGALGYAIASPFAPDWAYQNLGGYAEGFGNTVMGLGQTAYDVGAFASYGLSSLVDREFAYNNYGGSMERLGMAGTALTGGADNSWAYRAGYSAVGIGSLLIGGEFGQAGRVGRAGEVVNGVRQAANIERGVYFFGGDVMPYIDRPNATLGRSGSSHFFTPLDDMASVGNTGDAARLSGQAPSITRAYATGGDGYGIVFPTQGLNFTQPGVADAMMGGQVNPNFLLGGNTAVRLEGQAGGYLLNNTREFVTPGGNPMPSGSVLFQFGPNGSWTPLRYY